MRLFKRSELSDFADLYLFANKERVKPDMFALSTLMFVVILVLLILMNVAQTRAEKKNRREEK